MHQPRGRTDVAQLPPDVLLSPVDPTVWGEPSLADLRPPKPNQPMALEILLCTNTGPRRGAGTWSLVGGTGTVRSCAPPFTALACTSSYATATAETERPKPSPPFGSLASGCSCWREGESRRNLAPTPQSAREERSLPPPSLDPCFPRPGGFATTDNRPVYWSCAEHELTQQQQQQQQQREAGRRKHGGLGTAAVGWGPQGVQGSTDLHEDAGEERVQRAAGARVHVFGAILADIRGRAKTARSHPLGRKGEDLVYKLARRFVLARGTGGVGGGVWLHHRCLCPSSPI